MKRPLVGVVADEITGAGDAALMFARHGWATRLFTANADLAALPSELANERADVTIIDTDACQDDDEVADAKVRRATAALARWGAQVFYARSCSAFRGPVGAYFDAMLTELGHDFGVAVAAFPEDGRGVFDGLHADGPVERLPLAAVRSGHAALLHRLEEARKHNVRYLLADVEHQDDLGALTDVVLHEPVLLGSSAIAEQLARRWPTPEPFDPFGAARPSRQGGVLVLAGSSMPQARAQVAALREAGVHTVTLTAEAAYDGNVGPLLTATAYRLQRGQSVLVHVEGGPEAAGPRALTTLAAFAETACARLVVLGAEASTAVCRHLRIEEMIVVGEVAPGLPTCFADHPHATLLVLTNGRYGERDFALKAIAHLESLCHDRWT